MNESYAKKEGYKPIEIKLVEATDRASSCPYCGYPYLVEHYCDGEKIETICPRCLGKKWAEKGK